MFNEVMTYKLYLHSTKYKKYILSNHIIKPLLDFNNKSLSFNKGFSERCLNFLPNTFYCCYQIMKMFICYAKKKDFHLIFVTTKYLK